MMADNTNPWVGLRSYREGEILYGRDRDIRELSMFVIAEKELVIYGKSGTGKSSIINAGILPSAKRNGYIPVKIRLEHAVDSQSYVDQIKNAIEKEGVTVRPIASTVKSGKCLLWEFFHGNEFLDKDNKKVKLLVIFDQFEEIFTLQDSKRVTEDFFNELADLLNDIRPSELSVNVVEEENQSSDPDKNCLSNDDVFAQIENLDVNFDEDSSSYLTDIDVHFVFTLREDYLSEFEYYTRKIPSLKQNRYAFRPIDVNQAMDIIMNPRKGLVSEDVAQRIISKITKIDYADIPSGIGLDSSILSLFLSELYKRLPENAQNITVDMVEKFGDDIIKDFYVASVSDTSKIRPSSVEWIEDILLTKDYHRDNKDIKDVCDRNMGGLSEAELMYLENDKRILSRFKRSNATRIEFVHDVIADVAAQHKKNREADKLARQEQDELAKKAKRKFRLTILIAAVFVVGAIASMWLYMAKPVTGLPHKQSFIISLLEDSLTNENEYWKGELSVVGHRLDAPDTVLMIKTIDKGFRDSIFKIEIDTLRDVTFALQFPSYSKYQDISLTKNYSEIMKMLNVQIQLKKKKPKTYPYFGNVSVEANGIKWPVQNALICIHDITTRTDSSGNFRYYLEKEVLEEDIVYIIKKGYYVNDFEAGSNEPGQIHEFLLMPKDSIQSIETWVASIDSLAKTEDKTPYTIKNQRIYKKDGSTDTLSLLAVINEIGKTKYYINGYFYFHSDLKINQGTNKFYSYYKMTGEIDRHWNNGYKDYSVEGTNYIGNVIDITGTYKERVGSWTGEISSPSGFNAYFPEKP